MNIGATNSLVASLSDIRAARAPFDVPTTLWWRRLMKEKREALGMSQDELARQVGTSQATISGLETGKVTQSDVVPCVSVALGIALPFLPVEYDEQMDWDELGKALYRESPEKLLRLLEFLRADLATPKK